MDWFNEQVQHFETLGNLGERVLDGFLLTIQLTLIGGLLAFIVSVVLGLMAGSPNIWLRIPARIIIEFFRGISLLVMLFFVFYIVPVVFNTEQWPNFVVGVVALGVNYGAYGAEAVRASLTTVPKAQWEATTALSMTWPHKMRRVIFPQAWALMLPSLTNLWVHLLKGSAIVYVIGLNEFTFELDQLRRQTDIWFSHAIIGLVGYFILALILTLAMQVLEARAKHRLGRGPSLKEILSPTPKSISPESAGTPVTDRAGQKTASDAGTLSGGTR